MQYFRADDRARIAFSDEGAGLPVLCLAGLTRTGADFDYIAPNLADVRLIRMDYRGRGASEWTGAETYTVPREAKDALALLDHLEVDKAAIIGTSRGGLIAMYLAAVAKERLLGVCLNDVGPVLERAGLEKIFDYIGRNPAANDYESLAQKLSSVMPEFSDVPEGRWLEEARRLYRETPEGMKITYDPSLREPFLAAFKDEIPEAWPLFDAMQGLPVALFRGANSDLLSHGAALQMSERRPDMIFAEVPGRGHIPWLDEPEAVAAVRKWIAAVRG
ncbi:MAG: alpha/beta hydrolase [Paracoccus sp. (in: a-proteobacteria)]|nr:alpha/beta hydrolase [Paracoccus sp. (in: a-proteobacteria)]